MAMPADVVDELEERLSGKGAEVVANAFAGREVGQDGNEVADVLASWLDHLNKRDRARVERSIALLRSGTRAGSMLTLYKPGQELPARDRQRLRTLAPDIAAGLRLGWAGLQERAKADGVVLEPQCVKLAQTIQVGFVEMEVILMVPDGDVYFRSLPGAGLPVVYALDQSEGRTPA